ncbi:unnamed protein product [Kluyveromyces dobzhanskii CBS 2104]|uniref:WGS project CCBQ000000000 data, contig MAT n=1 Tax=Kluyveromyces dobzhanskii CBS 2104 TaxID=1427455 RepID=A0A0A8L3Y2_9SACH|nr:unnamed protein product [Kluyveromyces dobzhanskii CBS 2104]
MSSDSEPEELLMTNRSRRANAGNKMQKLLQQEIDELQKQTSLFGDDEINLLFQEDEEDEEFTVESKRRQDDEDMFSDSADESSGASDAEEGEHELQKQERQKRKVTQKKKNMVPVIKRAKKAPVDKVQKLASEELNAESFLTETRRTSKRSAVVANKLKVYENLTQAEKRRKLIQEKLRKQREKHYVKPLTQEERLKMAEETERINVSSLNKYKEQEISKKQSRLAMQLRDKMKFKDGEQIIRWISTQWEVSPLVELEDKAYWDLYTSKRDKIKKKYVRRKKAQIEEDNLRAASKEKELHNAEDEPSTNTADRINDETVHENGTFATVKDSANDSLSNELDPKLPEVSGGLDNHETSRQEMTTKEGSSTEAIVTKDLPNIEFEMKTDASESSLKTPDIVEETANQDSGHKENSTSPQLSPVTVTNSPPNNENNNEVVTASPKSTQTVRHITFAEEDQVSVINSKDPPIFVQSSHESLEPSDQEKVKEEAEESINDASEEPVPLYEGPVQRVGKNFVILYTFPDHPFTVQNSEVKKTIFGKNWERPSKSRPEEVETVIKLTSSEELEPLQSIFIPPTSILEKFPRFGEFNKKTLRTVTIDATKKDKIEIKSEAPTGVFLPNGIRKNCLITNKECKYFDPKKWCSVL